MVTNAKSTQVDYDYWIRYDKWSFKEAALIICGFNPDDYRHITLTRAKVPSELTEAYQLYKLLRSVDFVTKYGIADCNHPLSYVHECLLKQWPMDNALLKAAETLNERMIAINKQIGPQPSPIESPSKQSNYLLKIIAVLTAMYVEHRSHPRHFNHGRINVSVVTQDILTFLEKHHIHLYGLGESNLNNKIAKALRQLTQDAPNALHNIIKKQRS